MSLLTDLYGIIETSGASGSLLSTPTLEYITFDLDGITKENNANSSIFWNFGDPGSEHNEFVSRSVCQSIVSHTYKYPGTYIVNAIANVNGVLYPIEKTVVVSAAEPPVFIISNPPSGTNGVYSFSVSSSSTSGSQYKWSTDNNTWSDWIDSNTTLVYTGIEGVNNIYIYGKDNSNNISPVVTYTWTEIYTPVLTSFTIGTMQLGDTFVSISVSGNNILEYLITENSNIPDVNDVGWQSSITNFNI